MCTRAIFFRSAAKPAELKMDSARKATAATVVRRKDGTALIEIPFLDVWHARPGTPRRLHHRHGIAACLYTGLPSAYAERMWMSIVSLNRRLAGDSCAAAPRKRVRSGAPAAAEPAVPLPGQGCGRPAWAAGWRPQRCPLHARIA